MQLALFDGEGRQWVQIEGTRPASSVPPGAVLSGTVLERSEGRTLASARVLTRSTLVVGESQAGLPDPVKSVWRDRPEGHRRVTGVLSGEDADDRCEFHVSAVPVDLDRERLWERMLTGTYDFEPWFESLVELDGGARHLTVVDAEGFDPFVFFATTGDAPDSSVRARRESLGLDPLPRP